MKNIHNAATDVLDTMDIADHFRDFVEEQPMQGQTDVYHVYYRKREPNVNAFCRIEVRIPRDEDIGIVVRLREYVNLTQNFAELLEEELAVTLDPNYYEDD